MAGRPERCHVLRERDSLSSHPKFSCQGPAVWRRFDLERTSDLDLVARDPDLFFRLHPRRVVIDEAELLPELFPALRVEIDADVARGLGVSPPTVRDYFEIVHGTFLWRRLPPYVMQAPKRLVKHAKGHMRDSGLLYRLLHLADRDALLGQPQADRSWEAMVTGEILRQLEWRGLDCEAPRKAARARRGCRETVRRRDGSVRTRYRTLADVLGECRSAPRSHVFLMNPASAAHASQRSRAVLEG